MNLYFLNYNNYYNRLVKKEDTLAGYIPYQLGDVLPNVSFNPNDGINTTQVVNRPFAEIGDYLICAEGNIIVSRWFIIEAKRERTGQYTLQLRRDVFVDNYDDVVNAPCFIEKATLSDSDPMIFNGEDMTFNQIKKSEHLLKDETGCAWIVGYLASNTNGTVNTTYQSPASYTIENLSDYRFYEYKDRDFFSPLKEKIFNFYVGGYRKNNQNYVYKYSFNENGAQNSYSSVATYLESGLVCHYTYAGGEFGLPMTGYSFDSFSDKNDTHLTFSEVFNQFKDSIDEMTNQLGAYTTSNTVSAFSELLNENGKYIYVSSEDKYYKVNVVKVGSDDGNYPIESGNLYTTMKGLADGLKQLYPDICGSWSASDRSFSYKISKDIYRVQLVAQESLDQATSLTLTEDRYHLNDAPYDMFCIPYSDDLVINRNGVPLVVANKELAFNTAMSMAKQFSGSDSMYDIQLLPYCPVRYCIQADGSFDIKNNKYTPIIQTQGDTTTTVGVVLFASTSAFTINIEHQIKVTNPKVQSLTEVYRLCSPNYNGVFEFSPSMNGGVDYINVDCTYKPHTPYIHMNPNFKNMYGNDFNDSRGLVCGGDFSLPIVSSAWETYQIQNKNYNNIFDRQIQNMKVNNSVQKEREIWSTVTGAVGGATSGAITGGMIGGPIGAGIGAIVGGASSTLGGIRDIQLNDKLRNEAIDYTKDQFGYQLGNIQALPYGLSRTSAFTYNNKIFPFIEFYTCTEEERKALEDKLKYNGMTVMRIGKISEFIRPEVSYIKGKLIRFDGISEDFHYVNELANEINKGVFI